MSKAALQAMTGDIVNAFLGVGLADTGTYTAPAGSPITCRVIVDRAVAPFGDYGKVIGARIALTLLLEEIPAPVPGAIVAVDGDQFRLVQEAESDAAISKWAVEYV